MGKTEMTSAGMLKTPMVCRHGGQVLVDQLRIQGVERVFCVPGESYLAALDGLYRSGIDVVVARQEGGATMMAEAHGKLTGQPGIAFVTRGPGATNASSGVHVAFQDSTPLVLFIGQVARSMKDREAFQEVDYLQMFAPLAKWVAEIALPERIPEYISHAFHIAKSGRPGPVVLSIPEDVLASEFAIEDALPACLVEARATAEDALAVRRELDSSRRPFVLVGGGGWSAEASRDLAAFAVAYELPVGVSFRCQDYLDNQHSNYVGDVGIGVNPELAQSIRNADLLLLFGARLGEMTSSGYGLAKIPIPSQRLVHVYPDSDELGRVYRPNLAINASVPSLLSRLAVCEKQLSIEWREWTANARQAYKEWSTPKATPGPVQLEQIVCHLREILPKDAIVTNGAGNYSAWVHRYFRYRIFRSQLAPTSGSMGYGLPAAIAAKLAEPQRQVVCFAGDGCFQMTMQEFGTAVQFGANIVVILANNGIYGTIRMHQELHYPGRVSGTDLVNPGFSDFARAYGGFGEAVETTEDFAEALERALASGKPALLDLKMSSEALSPQLKLSQFYPAELGSA